MSNDGKFQVGNINNKKMTKKTGSNALDKTSKEPFPNKSYDNNTSKPAKRAAMAVHGAKSSPDRMLLDSGTISRRTDRSDRVQHQQKCDTLITLADDWTVLSILKRIGIVYWNTENGFAKVSPSDTFFPSKIATSLLSALTLPMTKYRYFTFTGTGNYA